MLSSTSSLYDGIGTLELTVVWTMLVVSVALDIDRYAYWSHVGSVEVSGVLSTWLCRLCHAADSNCLLDDVLSHLG